MANGNESENGANIPPKVNVGGIGPKEGETQQQQPAAARPVTKRDTMRLDGAAVVPRVPPAAPVDGAVAPAQAPTAVKGPPTVRIMNPKSAAPAAVETVKAKSDTSRVPLEEAQPRAAAAAPAQPSVIARGPPTVRIMNPKSAAPAAAPAGGVAAAAQKAKSDTSRVSLEEAQPAAVSTKTPMVAKIPTTIRLTKPAGGRVIHETARIVVPEAEKPAAELAKAAGGPKTIRIKRPDEAQTIRKVKTPTTVTTAAAPAAEEEASMSGRRTITVRRDDGAVSERSARMAAEELAMKRTRGEVAEGEAKPERFIWVCAVCSVTMIVIGFAIWLFCVQLLPKNKNLDWWGRVLPYDHQFFQHGERDWLIQTQPAAVSSQPQQAR